MTPETERCKNGHDRSEFGYRRAGTGHWRCRQCRRKAVHEFQKRARAAKEGKTRQYPIGIGALGKQEDETRRLWEETPETARNIAVWLNMRDGARITRNSIVGIAYRRRWVSFNEGTGGRSYRKPRTMDERIDALHAKLDRLLAETARRPEHSLGCPEVRL